MLLVGCVVSLNRKMMMSCRCEHTKCNVFKLNIISQNCKGIQMFRAFVFFTL